MYQWRPWHCSGRSQRDPKSNRCLAGVGYNERPSTNLGDDNLVDDSFQSVGGMGFRVDLNCDLGEAFTYSGSRIEKKIIPYLTSVNVACGFHAGNPTTMMVIHDAGITITVFFPRAFKANRSPKGEPQPAQARCPGPMCSSFGISIFMVVSPRNAIFSGRSRGSLPPGETYSKYSE